MRLKDMMKVLIPQDRLYRLHTIKLKSTNEPIEELVCAHCGGDILLVEEPEWYEGLHPNEHLLEIYYTCKDKQQVNCSKIVQEELILIFEEEKTNQDLEPEDLAIINDTDQQKDKLNKLTELILPIKVLRRLINDETVEFNNTHLHYIRPMKVKAEDRTTNRSRIINFSIDKNLGAVTTQELQLLFENLSPKTLQKFLLSLGRKPLEKLLREHGWQLDLKETKNEDETK
jgi:hypothetical protein